MSGFVERVINSPQTRCRSAKQVGLQMSSERQRGESCSSHRAAGKLFQMTGPATAKLLIPSVVVVLGTDSVPVQADRRCPSSCSSDSLDTSHRRLSVWQSLNWTRQRRLLHGSQCNCIRHGVTCSRVISSKIKRPAEFMDST